jgi:hypothetical protein
MSSPDLRPIVVAGDVSIDWFAWPLPVARGDSANALNWRQREGTRMVARRGGALLLLDLLRQATAAPVVGPRVDGIARKTPDECLHSIVDLEPATSAPSGPRRYHVARLRGFCGPDGCHPVQPPLEGQADAASVLVLDDSGNGFRDTETAWSQLIADAHPHLVIVKMARPLATGAMWDAVRHGPLGADGKPHPERLIVVINAEDLRAESIALSRRLSWERTAEDFVRELASNGRLVTLVTCAHLIVRFDCDGVIHHRGHSAEPPTLYFDPAHAEGEFIDATGSRMIGMTAAFTAGLAATLAVDPAGGIDAGIRRGMTAARRLATEGFHADANGAPDYPHALAMVGEPKPALVAVTIPSSRIVAGEAWSILDDMVGDPAAAARRVVTEGPAAALSHVPVASFNKLQTADRREIESFRAIGNLLREYLATPQIKPISIGVFGPPGAGKSFGVEQVVRHAAAAARIRNPELLEFNLSQFTGLPDLIAAFHLVRDRALGGAIPLVFFDEFDSNFGSELGWLRYFLAPMQDGQFREAGHAHPIGAGIFVFAGGTRSRFAQFVEPMTKDEGDPERKHFASVKGPDFASRLRGHVDILGPDPADPADRMHHVRRAFLLRALVAKRAPSLKKGDGVNVDEGVLNALLLVRTYRHGVRSMEAVLAMSALAGRTQFERAALPPADQLELHVDAARFTALVKGEQLEAALQDELARLLHEVYRTKRLDIAEDDAERTQLATDPAMRDWGQLDEGLRVSNRQQANDIPRKLRLIDCFMAPPSATRDAVTAFSDAEIALLAESEHDRWNAERLQQQWRQGARDPTKRNSPFLVPWSDLPAKWRSLDEAAVAAIPQVVASKAIGLHVYRAK